MWNWKLSEYFHFSCKKCLWWPFLPKTKPFWHYNKHFDVSYTIFCLIFVAFFYLLLWTCVVVKKSSLCQINQKKHFCNPYDEILLHQFLHFDLSLNVMRPVFQIWISKIYFLNNLTRFSALSASWRMTWRMSLFCLWKYWSQDFLYFNS